MNIRQAKEQIRRAVIAYRTKDENGQPMIPPERQRPVFLSGPPGIGKTAVAAQVAQEMQIGFVSYSITHHTRQSALGLPYIRDREFGGKHYRMSEYTMSEIIASVYEQMSETGVSEGILFLDEINCVSETLAPAMLQFLQYKVFGQHRVPDGWIVVTAGNPPEYNQAVREFDMVTQDRIKEIRIEPDYDAWRSWAADAGLHAAVLSYLDVRKEDLYQVNRTLEGMSFVTPRGWADLSDMLRIYEMNGLPCDELLIRQYLRNDRIARQFAVFYGLWKKYETEYRIADILDGCRTEELVKRAGNASLDEKIALINLLLDGAEGGMRRVLKRRDLLVSLKTVLKEIEECEDPEEAWERKIREAEHTLETMRQSLSKEELDRTAGVRQWLQKNRSMAEEHRRSGEDAGDEEDGSHTSLLRQVYGEETQALYSDAEKEKERLENLFRFAEKAFPGEGEMALIVTSLTTSKVPAAFIGRYGCEGYYRHSGILDFKGRDMEISREIDELLQ